MVAHVGLTEEPVSIDPETMPVTDATLQHLTTYMTYMLDHPDVKGANETTLAAGELIAFDAFQMAFFQALTRVQVMRLLATANFLDCPLMQASAECAIGWDVVTMASVDLRQAYGFPDDLTREQRAVTIRKNDWFWPSREEDDEVKDAVLSAPTTDDVNDAYYG